MIFLKQYKRELFVTLFLFTVLGLLTLPYVVFQPNYFFLIGSFGLILLFVWFLIIYFLYANKKVKRYGEVLIRVRFTDKFLRFFFLPPFFYIIVLLTIYFIHSFYLNLLIVLSFSFIIFVLMIHIRSSYEKIHYMSSLTKIIYDAVLVMIFFLGVFVLNSTSYIGFNVIYLTIGLTIVLLFYKLIIDAQICLNGLFLILITTIFIFIVSYLMINFNMFVSTAVQTLAFYLVVSMWSIRLAGYTEWKDYFNPFLYTLMGLILVFSL